MNKTHSITIGGRVFHIEEEAFRALETYLNAIKKHFASYEDKDEIIADIESRIAEIFTERLSTSREAVNAKDVDAVIKTMGYPEQFEDEETKTSAEPQAKKTKRLYRNPDDRVLCGLCSGIAAYLGVDPFIPRAILVVLFIVGFPVTIIIYLILCAVVPEATTVAQKVEMQGEPMTVSNITEQIKQEAEKVKNQHKGTFHDVTQKTSGVVARVLDVIKSILRVFFQIIGGLVGIIIMFSFGTALISLLFTLAVMVFNIHSPYVDFPFTEIADGPIYYLGVFAAFFAVAIPCFLIFLLGLWILRRKNTFSAPMTSALIGLWIISVIGVGVIAIDRAPAVEAAIRTQTEQRELGVRNFDVKDFDGIVASSAYIVNITPSSTFSVTAKGDARDLERTDIRVEDGETLVIQRQDRLRICLFCWSHPVEIDITMPVVKDLRLHGATKASVQGFDYDSLKILTTGASNLTINGNATSVYAELHSSSRVAFTGTADSLRLDASSAAIFNGDHFRIRRGEVDLRSSSRANFFIEKENHATTTSNLTIAMSSAARLQLAGDVDSVSVDMHSSSRLHALNLTVSKARFAMSGASSAEITVNDILITDLHSSSRLRYAGNPDIKETETSGASTLERY